MANVRRMKSELKKSIGNGPAALGATRVEIADSIDAGTPYLVVFIRTGSELTERMLSLPEFQYPLHLLMNNFLVFMSAAYKIRRGALVPAHSELMTAAIAGVAEGESWGTTVDLDEAILHVPQANFERLAEHIHTPTPADVWAGALLVEDWPRLPIKEPPSGTPHLQVVHVPDWPHEQLSNAALQRAVRLTVGWNFASLGEPEIIERMATQLKHEITQAELVVEY